MAEGDIPVHIHGNLVADPELTFTKDGVPVVRFRVAQSSRFFDPDEKKWVTRDTVYLTCQAWRHLAENVADSLERGMPVLVIGRFKQRTFDTADGPRVVTEVEASHAGPDLASCSAEVNWEPKGGGQGRAGASSS